MYRGIALNKVDVKNSFELISDIFYSNRDEQLLVPNECMLKENVVIIRDNKNKLIATCLIYPRTLFLNKRNIKTCFLSYICVREGHRRKNLGSILMNTANNIIINRGLILSFVIARKSVDYFYNHFGFVGISNYSEITISENSKLKKKKIDKINFRDVKNKDIHFLNKNYLKEYKKLPGSFERNPNHWGFILKKFKHQNIKIKIVEIKGVFEGYIIYNQDHVYEVCLLSNNYLNLIKIIFDQNCYEKLIFHIPKDHGLVREISMLDFTISERQCLYGGHMAKINNEKNLSLKINEENLSSKDNKVKKNYNLISEFLGLSKLKNSSINNSFNISLVDQL